jgi:hypothetical protein
MSQMSCDGRPCLLSDWVRSRDRSERRADQFRWLGLPRERTAVAWIVLSVVDEPGDGGGLSVVEFWVYGLFANL